MSLLPADNEIPRWVRENIPVYVRNPKHPSCPFELIKYGVLEWITQKYLTNKPKSAKLEVTIYKMQDSAKAKMVYDLLGLNTEKVWSANSRGYSSRINPSFLFAYAADFRKGCYFGRLVIENKTTSAFSIVKTFLSVIRNKI